MNYAGITEVLQLAPLFLPLLERLSPFYLSSTTLLFCPLLLALVLSIYIVQFFQGAAFQPLRPDFNTQSLEC